jgi:hypothetical protein
MKPMKRVSVPDWHTEEEAAELLGESMGLRRRNRRLNIGPKWVRHGRRILYQDGSEAEYLAELQEKAEAASEPRGRGRPRKAA